jgi:hypothetical protein
LASDVGNAMLIHQGAHEGVEHGQHVSRLSGSGRHIDPPPR